LGPRETSWTGRCRPKAVKRVLAQRRIPALTLDWKAFGALRDSKKSLLVKAPLLGKGQLDFPYGGNGRKFRVDIIGRREGEKRLDFLQANIFVGCGKDPHEKTGGTQGKNFLAAFPKGTRVFNDFGA